MSPNIALNPLKSLSAAARSHRQAAVLVAMLLSSLLCVFMLTVRIIYTHGNTYIFLAWNLMLAWLPLISAFFARSLYSKGFGVARLLAALCGCVWLAFLPNAPYLITDFIHLAPRNEIMFWFDLTMFVAFAWTGLLCGLVSLYWMQQLVVKVVGSAASWIFVVGVSGLSSYGIYLGRFQNWNSWDVVTNPSGLFLYIWESVRHPIAHYQTFAFSGFFALFLVAAYLMLSALTGLQQQE